MRYVYVLAQIGLILACYFIPYTSLKHSKDLSLYLFWVIAALISILLAVIKLHTTRSGGVR